MKSKVTSNLQNQTQRKEFWYQVCQEWLDSGLTKAKFCAKRKISKSALYKWLPHFKERLNINQLQVQPKSTAPRSSQSKTIFTPVAIRNEKVITFANSFNDDKPLAVELIFPNGIKLVLNQEFNLDLLTQLMAIRG